MGTKNLGLITLLLCLLMPRPAISQVSLRLATVDNFPPFSFIKQGRLTGVDVDTVLEMGKRLGIEIELEAFPWVRVMEYVKDGTVDGGFAAFLTEERRAFCLYTGILHHEEFHVFVKRGREFPFTDVTDLYGKTVGVDIGVYVSKAFEQAANQGKIIVEKVNDVDLLNLKKLLLGRLDAMVGDYGVTLYHAEKLKMAKDLISVGPVHEKQPAYLVLSKTSDFPDKVVWQNKMREALIKIREDGTYQSILNRYASIKPYR